MASRTISARSFTCSKPHYKIDQSYFFQAERRDTKTLAALKLVEIKADDDLEDFMVEIDILDKCRHKNVVGLHETYFYGGKLWVSNF